MKKKFLSFIACPRACDGADKPARWGGGFAVSSIYSSLLYSITSETSQSSIEQSSSMVFVVIASPCFMRCMVFAGMPCL